MLRQLAFLLLRQRHIDIGIEYVKDFAVFRLALVCIKDSQIFQPLFRPPLISLTMPERVRSLAVPGRVRRISWFGANFNDIAARALADDVLGCGEPID